MSYITSTMAPYDVTIGANFSENATMMCGGVNFSDCDTTHNEFLLSNKLVFGKYHVIRISVTWSFFFMSAIGNLTSLWGLLTRRTSHFGFRNLSNTQLIMLHMTLADIVYTFIILPTDGVWNYTLQWVAGDVVCKIMQFLKYFAMYSSSGMIMAMVFDRMLSILRPANYLQQKRQTKWCIGIAWVLAIVNAFPVTLIFGVVSLRVCEPLCPSNPVVMQCVDFVTKISKELLQIYYIYSMMLSFFVPVVTIIICQSLIGIEISKIALRDKKMMGRRHSETTKSINRARQKSMMLTIILATMFCICWGPYYVRGIFFWFNPYLKVSRWVELWMHVSMYTNPTLHPLFLAMFMKDVRRPFLVIGKKIKSAFDCFRWKDSDSGSGRCSVDERHQMLTTTTRLQSECANGKQVSFINDGGQNENRA